MSTPTLNKDIFNPSLYRQLRDVWFEGHELGAQEVDMKVLKRWFMASPEEREIFDGVCRENFEHALQSISPDKFPNPTAEPFLQEIQDAAQRQPDGDGAEAAWTALSMILLLDQIPRNLYRTNAGLANVYGHYDKISFPLVKALLSPGSPVVRPDLHSQWRKSVVHRMWFYMPLVHSEDIEAHKMHDEILSQFRNELEKEGGQDQTLQLLGQAEKAEKEHRDILDKFGRYPHRNEALGRQSTPEEEKFLAEGGATFGVAQTKRDV